MYGFQAVTVALRCTSKLLTVEGLGRALMILGAGAFLIGAAFWGAAKLGWLPLGRLPGDIVIQRNGFSLYFPIVTCIVLSLVGSIVTWLIGAFRR